MSSAVTEKGVPVNVLGRSSRFGVLRFVRMAVAFVVVAGSLGLATVTATAQNGDTTPPTEGDMAETPGSEDPVEGPSNDSAPAADGACPSDPSDNYADVDADSTHADDIACLKQLGIPAEGDNYRPDEDITRSEMARFMARTYAVLTGSPAEAPDNDFTDVEGDPNVDDIARIAALGITNGVNAERTLYAPDRSVSRVNMARFLARMYRAAAGSDAPDATTPFTDTTGLAEDAQKAIGQIFGLEVTRGATTTTYNPEGNVTRAQMASFVARTRTAVDALADAPGAPTGVEVAVEGTAGNQLSVSWTAPADDGGADITGYVVQWKSGDEEYDADSRQASTSDLSWDTPAALEKGTEYTFRVAAVNSVGMSEEWSAEASGTPGTTPGTVGELKVSPGNASGTLVLTWVAPEDDGGTPITGYGVRWGTGRATPETADVESGSATTYTIPGLTTGLPYWVQLRAVNGAGNGEYASPADSAQRTVTPTTSVASGSVRVTLFTEAANQANFRAGGQFASLTWRRPALQRAQNVKEYHIQRKCGTQTWPAEHPATPVPAEGTATQTPTSPLAFVGLTTANGALLTGLTNGEKCDFRVRAVTYLDRAGGTAGTQETGELDLVGAWVTGSGTPLGVPGAPANTEVTPGNNALNVSWTVPMTTDTPPKVNNGGTPITGYKIAWESGGPVGDFTVPASDTSYVIGNLLNNVAYVVKIQAINAHGASAEVTATEDDANGTPIAVPGAPTGVTVSQPAAPPRGQEANDQRGNQLIVSWSAPASNGTGAITGYVVERRTSAITMPTPVAAGTFTALAIPHTGTGTMVTDAVAVGDRGTSFDYRIRAVNANGMGPWSTFASGVAAALPSPVTRANIEVIPGNRSLTLTWTPAASNGSDVTHYLVRHVRNETGREGWSSQTRVAASALPTHTITGLTNGVPYAVEIIAVNDVGSSGETQTGGADRPTSVRPAPSTVTAEPLGTADNTDGDMLTVTWSAVPDAAGYVVEYLAANNAAGTAPGNPNTAWTRVNPAAQTPSVAKTVGDDSVATFDAAQPRKATIDLGAGVEGATYVVRVRVVTQGLLGGVASGNAMFGVPGFSDPVKAAGTPDTAPTVAAPSQVPKTRTVRVQWTPPSDAVTEGITGYKITWYPTSAAVRGNSGSTSLDADARSYDITGLSAVGQAITIIVTSVNEIGDGNAAPVSHTLTAPSS